MILNLVLRGGYKCVNKYEELMARKNEIILKSIGIDYSKYETGKLSFDYEGFDE